jgi:hypothetical protein
MQRTNGNNDGVAFEKRISIGFGSQFARAVEDVQELPEVVAREYHLKVVGVTAFDN